MNIKSKYCCSAGFINTGRLKNKTQEKKSRKKLNLWEDFLSKLENSRKKLKFPLKTQNFLRGGTVYVIFINKIFQKVEFFESFVSIFSKFKRILQEIKKKPKNFG